MKMTKMYERVFEDAVKCYVENMEEEDIVKISENDIKDIAYKMIYRNEYLWEIINETIDTYIGLLLNERSENNGKN